MNTEKGYVDAPIAAGTDLAAEIVRLKREQGAVVLAHYYQRGEIQELADHIGDSLALAQVASRLDAPTIVMCGVNFMAETAKILCPEKRVLCPDLSAGCSLADSCPAEELRAYIAANPGHTVVSYVNTSAAVKALTDVVVTSSNARQVVESLPADTPIIFGPDRNLGDYINSLTGRRMKLWPGACHVHERFSVEKLIAQKREHPGAKVLAHPECPRPLLLLADVVGSTAALLRYAAEAQERELIVATESGILHEMRRRCPDKTLLPAAPSDACGCNECAYMKLNTLEKLYNCLRYLQPEVVVDPEVAERARRPIERMLEISSRLGL